MNTHKIRKNLKTLNENLILNTNNDQEEHTPDVETIKKSQEIKKYRVIDFISRWSIKFWTEFYKMSVKKRSIFLIIMQTRNKKYDHFTVATDLKYFYYKGGVYFLDSDFTRDDIHSGLSSLYYHQDCSIPFRIDIDTSKLKDEITQSGNDDVIDKAINPSTLKGFVISQVIEKILKGEELSKDMDFMKKLIIINLLMSLIMCFGIAKAVGWIK